METFQLASECQSRIHPIWEMQVYNPESTGAYTPEAKGISGTSQTAQQGGETAAGGRVGPAAVTGAGSLGRGAEKIGVMRVPVSLLLSPLSRCQCDCCSWVAGCGTCAWLSVPIVEVEDSECFGCLWLESRLARDALHGLEGEASVTGESREERKRRLTRERVRRHREGKQGG